LRFEFDTSNRAIAEARSKKVDHQRTEIMEKAKAKRRRREARKAGRNASCKGEAVSSDAATRLTGKVVDLAQETAAQVGAFVTSAARIVTGAES
jgi:hypothetical protein